MKKIAIKIVSLILILSFLICLFQVFFINSESYAALSETYTQYVKSGISAFPESYQKKLAYLKYLHPNWEFKAYYTGINWDELTSTSAENACKKNTVHKGKLLDPAALCKCGYSGDPGYYDASNIMVKYYLDPRNFLGEAMVFQFLDLASNDGITRENVLSATKNTYLEKYTDDIMTAASEARINPLHIVATIFQELGSGKYGIPDAISGTVPGYEGYYNFYNYGATDGVGAVERGLATAKDMKWNNPGFALIDGAKKILANDYISVGQTTKYFYKFDVVGNEILTESMGNRTYRVSGNFYGHQYMTNLRDPSSQAGSLYDIYANNSILDTKLTFTIPVYNNMPNIVSAPTSLTSSDGELYYIDSMKKYGIEFRTGAGTGYSSMGNLYKDTVVAVISKQGTWSKVKVKVATSFNTYTRQWNYEEKIGYVSTEYLTKVGTDIPDYRDQVDIGSGTGTPSPLPEVFGKPDLKVEDSKIVVTPASTVGTVLTKYPGAIVKKSNGTVMLVATDLISSGAIVTINGKVYSIVKYGDSSGDGKIDSADLAVVQKHLLGISKITNEITFSSADANKDGKLDSADLAVIQKYLLKVSDIEL